MQFSYTYKKSVGFGSFRGSRELIKRFFSASAGYRFFVQPKKVEFSHVLVSFKHVSATIPQAFRNDSATIPQAFRKVSARRAGVLSELSANFLQALPKVCAIRTVKESIQLIIILILNSAAAVVSAVRIFILYLLNYNITILNYRPRPPRCLGVSNGIFKQQIY